jgi:hypothetical protein
VGFWFREFSWYREYENFRGEFYGAGTARIGAVNFRGTESTKIFVVNFTILGQLEWCREFSWYREYENFHGGFYGA